MTPQLSGILVAHQPVCSPCDDMRLPLRDRSEASRAGVGLDGSPSGDVSNMPSAVE